MNKKIGIIVIFLLLIIGLAGYWYFQRSNLGKPTVTVDDVTVEDVSTRELNLNVRMIVENPNPIGAHLTKVEFDVYYFRNGEEKYLGQGGKKDIDIRKNGDTTVTIPVSIVNKRLISGLVEFGQKQKVTVKVDGSAYLDLKATTFEVPFTENKTIKPEVLSVVTGGTQGQEDNQAQDNQETEENERQSLQLIIDPKPAGRNEQVTITVLNADTNPIGEARVFYIKAAETAANPTPAGVIANAKYLGKTDDQGTITHEFRQPEVYIIAASKSAEYNPGMSYLTVKLRE